MVLRLELALRAAAVRLHQPVVGVVAVVLFVQAVTPADQVAPGVVTVKQFLPVRQAVVGDRRQRQVRVDVVLRAAFAQQVIRQIAHQPRDAQHHHHARHQADGGEPTTDPPY